MKFVYQQNMTGEEIKRIRKQLNLTQKEFAQLVNVSKPTVERWESSGKPVSGTITVFLKVLKENYGLKESLEVPKQIYPLRLWYLQGDDPCTLIDVDERTEQIRIKNFTSDYMSRAFGKNEAPTYSDYMNFLESRCFPRSRDKMKLQLKELNLPFYDPFLIIQKTEGRMAEDNFRIVIE